MYLNLLILCGITYQGIIGTFLSDDDQIAENSLNLHIRKKRIVYHSLSEYREWSITDVPYIVKILQNGTKNCAGIIVSPMYILTAKICLDEQKKKYTVESGELLISSVQTHRVTGIFIKKHLALARIDPMITSTHPSLHQKILLFEGPVPPNTLANISGLAPPGSRIVDGMEAPHFRQLTNIPIIDLETCFNYYIHRNYELTNDNICTLELSGERGCTTSDAGSALVVDNKLLGVLIFAGKILDQRCPDVFIRVNAYNEYHIWIKSFLVSYHPYSHHELHVYHPQNQYPDRQHPHTSH